MRCPRCSGVMVIQKFFDMYYTFEGWRCVNCGSIVDNLILQNRRKAKKAA